jgi:NADH-quinone oxidoreductase subunit E
MAQINNDYYEDLTPERFNRLLDDLAAGKAPRPGPQVQRQFSAPIGGPTTLTDPTLYPAGAVTTEHPGPGTTQHGGPPLTDTRAKRPGEAASFREADVPQTPAADSSGRTS